MTRYTFATLDQWTAKGEKRMEAVLKQSANDMLKDIKIVTGITRGGTLQRGAIPRDLGSLAGSLQSTLFGSTAISGAGEDSYVLVLGQMQAGDKVRFAWGGANAPYARRIHYGFQGTDSLGRTYNQQGTFWRDDAAAKWESYVNAATIRAKAEIP